MECSFERDFCVGTCFRFDDLIHILDEHCLQQNKSVVDPEEWSKFDFVYLPVDYR